MTTCAPRTISSASPRPWDAAAAATSGDARGFKSPPPAYPADPSVMPTPSAADADGETTASPKQTPKSAPSPKPTPEVRPRSEARTPPGPRPCRPDVGFRRRRRGRVRVDGYRRRSARARARTKTPVPDPRRTPTRRRAASPSPPPTPAATPRTPRRRQVAVEDVENAVENVFDSTNPPTPPVPDRARGGCDPGRRDVVPAAADVRLEPAPPPVTLPERRRRSHRLRATAVPRVRAGRGRARFHRRRVVVLPGSEVDVRGHDAFAARVRTQSRRRVEDVVSRRTILLLARRGPCAAHQVAAAGRTPGCAVSRDAPAWTSTMCGEEGGGRAGDARAAAGEKTCVENLDDGAASKGANTCNTYTPNHMCPPPDGARRFWQATARMLARRARPTATREANRRGRCRRLARTSATRARRRRSRGGGGEGDASDARRGGTVASKEAVLTAAHRAGGGGRGVSRRGETLERRSREDAPKTRVVETRVRR